MAIDTGALVKEFRRRERSSREEAVALVLAERYGAVERAARGGLSAAAALGGVVGAGAVAKLPELLLRRRVSSELIPTVPTRLPPPAAPRLPPTARAGAAAVYLPACINRIFGNPSGMAQELSLPDALVAVSARAGLPLWIPHDVAGHCCATPWSSKGYRRGQDLMAAKTAAALWRWSEEGALTVVIDASSCALGLLQDIAPRLPDDDRARFERIEVLDSIAWAPTTTCSPVCRSRTGSRASRCIRPARRHSSDSPAAPALAAELADEVLIPVGTTCCGMAGDRGLLHPELPASALRDVAVELGERPVEEHLCSNRTCEIALQQSTGAAYGSFVLLLERLTRPNLSAHAHHPQSREGVLQ